MLFPRCSVKSFMKFLYGGRSRPLVSIRHSSPSWRLAVGAASARGRVMLFDPIHASHFDRLTPELRNAPAPTPRLVESIIAGICTRLPNLGRNQTERIDRMIVAGAWSDTALAVI